MATTIVTKNSSTASAVPTAAQLVQGELAVNVADKRLYTEDNAGAVVELGTNPSTIDINSGTIDGTTIGASSASTGAFTTLSASGEITANGGIALGDNDKATFGAGDDLQIYHDGSNSYIDEVGTGNLLINADSLRLRDTTGSPYLLGNVGAEVRLYHAGSTKLSTTATGIDVTGTATMDGLVVDGDSTIKGGSGVGNDTATLQLESTETQAIGSGASVSFKGDDGTGSLRTFGVIKGSKTNAASGDFSGGLDFFTRLTAQANATKRLAINSNGDISFYEDTGTTAKLKWSASNEDLNFADNVKATFGASDDLAIYHNGNNSFIEDTGTGNLYVRGASNIFLQGASNNTMAQFVENGFVKLFHNTVEKLATTATGIDVTGSITTTGGVYLGGTGAANLLDDYEEGTWTATIADAPTGGNTTSTYTGRYRKIGTLVTVFCSLTNIDTTGLTAANVLYVQGLPFTSNANNNTVGVCKVDSVDLSTRTYIYANMGGNDSWLNFQAAGNNIAEVNIDAQHVISGTSDIEFTIQYIV